MIAAEQSAALLLCAGLSERFGPANKLLHPLRGKPLAAHAADLLAGIPFKARIAVAPPAEPQLRALLLGIGFELVENSRPEEGQQLSLRLGLAAALHREASAILVALGDMPRITSDHLDGLLAAAGENRAAMSGNGEISMPPLVVPAQLAREILDSDMSARDVLEGRAVVVAAPAEQLVDFDTFDQFD